MTPTPDLEERNANLQRFVDNIYAILRSPEDGPHEDLARLRMQQLRDARAEVARLTAENAALREGLREVVATRGKPGREEYLDDAAFSLAMLAHIRAARLTEPKETENG
jgi:hypothetical protein